MKTFDMNGVEIGKTPSPQSWESRYYKLKNKYETLEKMYNELRSEMSWRTNTTRWGS